MIKFIGVTHVQLLCLLAVATSWLPTLHQIVGNGPHLSSELGPLSAGLRLLGLYWPLPRTMLRYRRKCSITSSPARHFWHLLPCEGRAAEDSRNNPENRAIWVVPRRQAYTHQRSSVWRRDRRHRHYCLRFSHLRPAANSVKAKPQVESFHLFHLLGYLGVEPLNDWSSEYVEPSDVSHYLN